MDLFYRIEAGRLKIPPLRERVEDIPILAKKFTQEEGVEPSQEVVNVFVTYAWLGNVRELRNAVQKHPDPENLEVLMNAVGLLGNLPALPTRHNFDPLEPEGFDREVDDEVILNPDEIARPLDLDFGSREGS